LAAFLVHKKASYGHMAFSINCKQYIATWSEQGSRQLQKKFGIELIGGVECWLLQKRKKQLEISMINQLNSTSPSNWADSHNNWSRYPTHKKLGQSTIYNVQSTAYP